MAGSVHSSRSVAATVELQGYYEGWSISQFFFFSERDWSQLGLLRSLLNVESSDPTNPWKGWFESKALDNGLSGAFHYYQDLVGEAAIEAECDRRARLRPLKKWPPLSTLEAGTIPSNYSKTIQLFTLYN